MTLNDTKTAVNKLHQMVNVVVAIVVVVIWLLILGIATTHFLVLISSQLLLVAFIFGNTCKTTFEAIVFLFVMHPFDVGDRCEVDGVQVGTDSPRSRKGFSTERRRFALQLTGLSRAFR